MIAHSIIYVIGAFRELLIFCYTKIIHYIAILIPDICILMLSMCVCVYLFYNKNIQAK